MSRLGHALIAPLLLALSLGALASGVDTYQFRHPERQTRAQELARALRCPQCQNQNLVESNSPIARDLRLEVYRWVDEGQSDEQVIARMTERFGDFVRYDPPFKRSTALLWGGPPSCCCWPSIACAGACIAGTGAGTAYRRQSRGDARPRS